MLRVRPRANRLAQHAASRAGFLAFELTGSYAALGGVNLAGAVASPVLALSGGVLAERVNQKRYVVQGGQLVGAINVFVIATLLVTDLLRFEHLLVSAAISSGAMAVLMPAQQALIPEIVASAA